MKPTLDILKITAGWCGIQFEERELTHFRGQQEIGREVVLCYQTEHSNFPEVWNPFENDSQLFEVVEALRKLGWKFASYPSNDGGQISSLTDDYNQIAMRRDTLEESARAAIHQLAESQLKEQENG